jgi:hypothetical protein
MIPFVSPRSCVILDDSALYHHNHSGFPIYYCLKDLNLLLYEEHSLLLFALYMLYCLLVCLAGAYYWIPCM